MKKQNISIVVSVWAKSKKKAKRQLITFMNRATIVEPLFPEWGFHSDYKMAKEKVKK